jgi:CheY-like chemotaxis protein
VRPRILVVEDNDFNLELLQDWLEMEGYDVLPAADLETARVLAGKQAPHAVLLDVQVGDEDGLALAGWIRRQPALHGIPIIAVTAHAMVSERDRILMSGCNGYVSKPIDFALLGEQLRGWLGQSGRQENEEQR